MSQCKWQESWVGQCKEDAIEGSEYCTKHSVVKCCSCSAQATHSCECTMGLVCGAPLCDDCEHEISAQGTCGMSEGHIKKTDQKYTSWYERKDDEGKKLYNDAYPKIIAAIIHEVSVIELMSRMNEFEATPQSFRDLLKKMVKEKEEELYKYIKEYYPSAIRK